MPNLDKPLITVAICTRNRGNSLISALESILANSYPNFELIVIDQSTNEDSAEAVASYRHDPRLRYIKSNSQGVGFSRNIVLSEAHSEIVIFTDDDCAVPQDWVETMAAIFTKHPKISLVFCNVEPALHDMQKGFIPSYMRENDELLTDIKQKCLARGIGAGMAVRRSDIQDLGGFDNRLGAGSAFYGCEDGDIAVRALLKGHYVFETAHTSVLHFGFRTHAEGRALARRDWYGIGAAYSKPVKAGHRRFWIVPAYEFFCLAVGPWIRDILQMRKPQGIRRGWYFLSGFVQGWRTPIDRNTLLFR